MDIYKTRLTNGNDVYLGIPIEVNDVVRNKIGVIKYFNERLGHSIVCSAKYIYSIYDAG